MPEGHDATIEVCNIMSFVLYTQILKQSVLKPASPGITLSLFAWFYLHRAHEGCWSELSAWMFMYTSNSFPVLSHSKTGMHCFQCSSRRWRACWHKFGSSLWGYLERSTFCTSICTFLSFWLQRLVVTGNVWSVNKFNQIPLDDFYGTPN